MTQKSFPDFLFYPNYHLYPLFLGKPEVETSKPGFSRVQKNFAVVSEKFRLFESFLIHPGAY